MIRVLLCAVLLVVTACSSAPAAPSGPLVLSLSVDQASPQRVEAVKGQAVELTVTSSGPVDVHVHGFDVLAKADKDKPAVLRFVADQTGTFDVEAHPDTLLVQLVVR
ncbi:hypothetical protein ABZ816_14535 [Actinosynnema sp. NPDC047251]|uniref:Secreted protein n=1 Tax=Saccharothrix espanaensis (strain ATCC 51144 / DSM 44229 / JCM 9112 / NBRC 15066 / NRRL 15764) TaxID=1179773 RepID=K0JYH2_SACES|nr:hypothetical protein [Saccharothrix espanaensis]CCH29759.1 hypothetical protein BN6_24450 [Saccharothrix espanaensis DSM 44229]